MKRPPKALSCTLATALLSTLAAIGLSITGAPARAAGPSAHPDPVAQGKYLVDTAGCMDCHTPMKAGPNGPEPDLDRLYSGHPQALTMPPAPTLPAGPWLVVAAATNTAWSGPWGVSFTANLTPDDETGLGRWTERDFIQTLRTGRHMGKGRVVLPPMPVQAYSQFNDRDLSAIYAYLRSIPAIKNRVPEPLPPAAAKP